MSLLSKLRSSRDEQPPARRVPSPRRAPGKAPKKPAGLTPFRQGLVLGGCIGMTFALSIGAIGFLVTRPTIQAPAAGTDSAAAPGPHGAHPKAAIDITATHLGDLQVKIEAKVSAPGSYDPITKAQVVAHTDMVAMPMAHRQGPIVMAEVPGKPGTYQALTQVAMVGEYNVTVETLRPMASKADRRLDVREVSGKS
ncbi:MULTISPECIES: hypothetical protein [Nonomuraea]|jgi:hypothetical protein|uniref:YtkA-like domain-containing protein n=1 Tax=Nonomuraea salmonea TaxID=46181 RepID=A0ABV5NZR2_9ACTN